MTDVYKSFSTNGWQFSGGQFSGRGSKTQTCFRRGNQFLTFNCFCLLSLVSRLLAASLSVFQCRTKHGKEQVAKYSVRNVSSIRFCIVRIFRSNYLMLEFFSIILFQTWQFEKTYLSSGSSNSTCCLLVFGRLLLSSADDEDEGCGLKIIPRWN